MPSSFKIVFIIIFIEIAVGVLVAGLAVYFFKNKASMRSKMRAEIIQRRAASFGNAVWFPIRYSSDKYFQRIWKFLVWEKSGILFLDKGSIFFVSEDQIDQSLVINLTSSETYLNWVGMKLWPNGLLYWFSTVSNGETHYFTSETGTFIFTSRMTTERVYNKLREYVD
jgi:hypothetical protein